MNFTIQNYLNERLHMEPENSYRKTWKNIISEAVMMNPSDKEILLNLLQYMLQGNENFKVGVGGRHVWVKDYFDNEINFVFKN